MSPEPKEARLRAGTVQSIERAFTVLELMADRGGTMGLSQLAAESGLPLPTIHRLVRTLVDLGYLRQEPSRQYLLGPRLIRLGESSSRLLGVWARPHLSRLVDQLGESANLAMLDGTQVVYVAQVPSRRAVRMFTEVGRRVMPHCTAVGKAILSRMSTEEVRRVLAQSGLPRHTEHTLTDPERFVQAVARCADQGFALDEEEQELGVRCVAVAVPGGTARLAVSVSGPAVRIDHGFVERAVPLLTEGAAALSRQLE